MLGAGRQCNWHQAPISLHSGIRIRVHHHTALAQRMSQKRMGSEVLDLVADRFKALGDRARLSLLQELRGGPLTVNELAASTEMGQANVSRHLAVLFANGLVDRERDGVFVRYELADKDVIKLCDLVCGRLENELSERRRVISGR